MALSAAPDDSALIDLVLAGNGESFGVLMDRHLAVVRARIIGMTRSVADVDDIMQEVQLKIWRRLGSFRSEASFRTWMTRVAINELLQFYRKANRLQVIRDGGELMGLTSTSESPLQALVRAEHTERLKAAVERLPHTHKEVLVLRTVLELSLRETAQELRVTTDAVKTRYFRAKAALSRALMRDTALPA